MNDQFSEAKVEKHYHALVEGCPDWGSISVKLPLKVDGDRRHRTVVDRVVGVYAHTDFTRKQVGQNLALIEATPRTGRTHQIRAHLAAIDHPILGDTLYGSRQETHKLEHMALQAVYLGFIHPIEGNYKSFRINTLPGFLSRIHGSGDKANESRV
jgi:23S rRNA-/tRNA-specific pseudouridylate synthase